MTELSRLIARLQRGISRSSCYIKTIRHPELLVVALQELNDLIGNDKVKDSVATQVSHLIMIKRRALDDPRIKEDEVMLNTVLYGPPGVGKTLVGTKLAKIWYSLGYLDASRNVKEKKQEIGDILKDLFKDGNNSSSSSSDGDTALIIYVVLIFAVVFVTLLSLSWSFYNKFGAIWTLTALAFIVFIILIVGYYISGVVSQNNSNDSAVNRNSADIKGNTSNNNDRRTPRNKDTPVKDDNPQISETIKQRAAMVEVPSDDQIIKVVTRADFVDRYVGWTSPKTIKLLEENLGKVLFVDEAYSLINGPHDEFGMEALTALNLFLSQRPKEIIVIFAGYKDLLQTGVYSVQPGLKRRFMWQFDCNGYTSDQLFDIFKMQLNKKGWGVNDEDTCQSIFRNNMTCFPSYGGDTERLAFFSELEHSRDFIANEKEMAINMLDPHHIERGLSKLQENDIKDDSDGSSSVNPLANMMKLISGKSNNSADSSDLELINSIREKALENNHR